MALAVTAELITRAAASLSAGDWRYSPKQLYYATCAEAETPATPAAANGAMALGVLCVLVALILIGVRVAFAALLSLGIALIAYGLVTRLSMRPASGRVLAISFDGFERLREGLELPGLVEADAPPPAAGRPGLAIVCDTADTAAAVSANVERAGLVAVAVLHRDSMPSLDGEAATALHDASPRGCALVLELHDAGVEVLDAGLRPAWVDTPAFQTLEGAPARLPRDLSPLLTDGEIAWLGSGRRVELAVLPPERLLRLVRAAVDLAKKHPDASGSGASGLVPSLPELP